MHYKKKNHYKIWSNINQMFFISKAVHHYYTIITKYVTITLLQHLGLGLGVRATLQQQ